MPKTEYNMDNYTSETKRFLEKRFNEEKDNIYFAHQPIYGYRNPHTADAQISKYMVIKSILNVLKDYSFSNFIDIGGAEGWTAYIVRKLFNVKIASTDLSESVCKIAKNIFNLEAIACDIHNLPFSDDEFDAVVCSETIEHVTDYKKAVAELLRITKNVLIITVPHETPEMVAETIRKKIPHGHIHYFDIHTLNYLKESGCAVRYEKTLSPLLVQLRVMIEGYKKSGNKILYKLYNAFTPIFKKIFGIKSACKITNLDKNFAHFFGFYNGITFIIEKRNCSKIIREKEIKAQDFIGMTVKEYVIK